jgi:hypothetical protein
MGTLKEFIKEIKSEALSESIEKWKSIVNKTGHDQGAINCRLCKIYYDDDCKECPVHIKTGKTECDNTPWEKWYLHHKNDHHGNNPDFHITDIPVKIECRKCKRLAKKELKFLKSLLPKNSK